MLRDFEGQSDLMDYIDEELAVILGHEFLQDSGRHPSPSGEPPLRAVESKNLSPIFGGDCPWPATLDFRNKKKKGGNSDWENSGQESPPDAVEGCRKELRRDIEGTKRASKARRVRPASQTYDHIISERKRREQLSRCFIALSTMVPGLKKMDKTSVLGDTIKYLEHLQDKVISLEEQVSRNTMDSVVLVSKSHVVEDESSSDERSWAGPIDGPEIEARVSGKSVLLKVICEKQKGVLVRLVAEVENLGLTVVNTSVTPFGGFSLAITIIAEMDKEVSLSGKDMVKALRLALKSAGSIKRKDLMIQLIMKALTSLIFWVVDEEPQPEFDENEVENLIYDEQAIPIVDRNEVNMDINMPDPSNLNSGDGGDDGNGEDEDDLLGYGYADVGFGGVSGNYDDSF